ncbi:MAG: hypothetical protein BWY85_00730 [Firmicutes bacterium ADurb.Bin506]|nr:MAG: hypothetical protein BWY85_00730 [Firmicutes bacterium ADurb.Bin506]
MTAEATAAIWVCSDCMFHEANGECSSCPGQMFDGHDREPWNLLDREPEGSHVTLGMTLDEHDHDCAVHAEGECDKDCEQKEFSWSSCDGCGSTLGGSRHAATLWIPKKEN